MRPVRLTVRQIGALVAQRVKVGDVVEIPTSKGLAYAQCTHSIKQWGHLLRVLAGFHERRPQNFTPVVEADESFRTFFPLQAAVSKGIFQVVANVAVPEDAIEFPLFRAAGHVDREGVVHNWFLWDGEKEWRVDGLTEEQFRLPLRQVVNDTLLIERLEEGWTPYTDKRSRGKIEGAT